MVRPFYWGLAYGEYSARHGEPDGALRRQLGRHGRSARLAGLRARAAFRVGARDRLAIFLGRLRRGGLRLPVDARSLRVPELPGEVGVLAPRSASVWFAEPRERVPAWAWYAISALVVAVLGSLTKAQFVVFLPAFVLLVLDHAGSRGEAPGHASSPSRRSGVAAAARPARRSRGTASYTEGFGRSQRVDAAADRTTSGCSGGTRRWCGPCTPVVRCAAETLLRRPHPDGRLRAFVVVFAQWPGGFLCDRSRDRRRRRLRARRLAPPLRRQSPTAVVAAGLVWACTWIGRADERALRLAREHRRVRPLRPRRCRSPPRRARLHLVRGGIGRDRRLRPPRAGPAARRSTSAQAFHGRSAEGLGRRLRASALRSSTRTSVPRLIDRRRSCGAPWRTPTAAALGRAVCPPRSPRPKTTGKASAEHREHVDVVERHREVEEVRGKRSGERCRHPPRERDHARSRDVTTRCKRAPDATARPRAGRRGTQTKTPNTAVPTSPVSTIERDVERVRAPVRLARDLLVVDGEVVQAEAEQRLRGEDVRDEVVDAEVRLRRVAARPHARRMMRSK